MHRTSELLKNSYKIFSEIVEAIKTNNIEKIADLISTYTLSDLPELAYMTDSDGNTIAHHICISGNLSLARLILKGNEYEFTPSFYIKNKNGSSALECTPTNEDGEKLKAMLTHNFLSVKPSFCQQWILDQFRVYLFHQLLSNPEDYSYDYVKKIMRDMRPGRCFGLSSIWAKSCLKREFNIFPDLLHDIAIWDRNYQSLNRELMKKFEKAISLVRSHQDFPFEIEELELANKEILARSSLFKELQAAKDFKYEQREPLSDDDVIDPNHEYEIIKNWGKSHYQCESHLFVAPTNINFIENYFELFLRNENNGKTLVFNAQAHTTAAFFLDGKFYYYDPNFITTLSDPEKYVSTPLGILIDITAPDHLSKISDLIKKSFYSTNTEENTSEYDWGTSYPINIRCVDLLGKKVGNHPTAKQLEAIWDDKARPANKFSW